METPQLTQEQQDILDALKSFMAGGTGFVLVAQRYAPEGEDVGLSGAGGAFDTALLSGLAGSLVQLVEVLKPQCTCENCTQKVTQ